MALRDDLLSVVDLGGALAADFGLRRYDVKIRVRTWETAIGRGTYTDQDLTITPRPDVQLKAPFAAQLSGIMTQAGTVEDRYFELKNITPQFVDPDTLVVIGGYTPEQLVPKAPNDRTEILVILTGDDGKPIECTIVGQEFDDPFKYELTVREKKHRTSRNAP